MLLMLVSNVLALQSRVAQHQAAGRVVFGIRMHAKPRRVMAELPFATAREKARSMGFSSQEEFEEYDCAGAYQLPKNPDVVWAEDWGGWGDWLGLMLPYDHARASLAPLALQSEGEYRELKAAGEAWQPMGGSAWTTHALRLRDAPNVPGVVDVGRLPAQPDRFYKREWLGWDHFLGGKSKS